MNRYIAMRAKRRVLPIERERSGSEEFNDLERNELIDRYYNMTNADIGREFGISASMVSERLKYYGIVDHTKARRR